MRRVIKARNAASRAEPLPAIRFHDLRHTHATLLLLAGVPVHVVAARLGHQDPAITLRVCAHVLRTPAAEAALTFAQAVDPDGVAGRRLVVVRDASEYGHASTPVSKGVSKTEPSEAVRR